MVTRIPLVGLTLCAFAPAGCQRQAPTPAPPGERAEPSGPPAAVVEAEVLEPGDCRVLVNGQGQVLDVTLRADGSAAKVERAAANVMVVEGRTFVLTSHTEGLTSTNTRVEIRELPEGVEEVVASDYASLGSVDDMIDDCVAVLGGADPMGCNEGYYGYDFVMIEATIGPYLSMSTHSGGYTGGAHAIESVELAMWNLGASKREQVEILPLIGEAGTHTLEQALEDYGVPEDYEVALDDYEAGMLTLGSSGSLDVELGFGCCSWAYNHGHFELDASLGTPVPQLAAYVPDPETGRWQRPGCGSVDLEGVVRDEAGRELARLDDTVLGIYWVDPELPLDLGPMPKVEDLEHPDAPEAETESPGPLGRRLMKAERYAEAAAAFEAAYHATKEARWLGELCWAEFKLQNYDQATAVCAEALRGAPDARALAAIIYNLGRIAEAQGELDTARSRYAISLRLRPNATVEARMAKLDEA